MKTARYSIEHLYHFRCGKCKGWWSISDFDTSKRLFTTCPHCGSVLGIKENTVDE